MSLVMKETNKNDKVDHDDPSKSTQQTDQGSMIGTSAIIENKGAAKVEVLGCRVLIVGREDIIKTLPFPSANSKSPLFIFKEGAKHRTFYQIKVSNNIVTGLTYTATIYKAGIKLEQTVEKLGTFTPREEPYSVQVSQGTVPTGLFSRTTWFVKIKFIDDQGTCYLESSYYCEVKKDWPKDK